MKFTTNNDATGIRFFRASDQEDEVCINCLKREYFIKLYADEDDFSEIFEDENHVECTYCGDTISEGVSQEQTRDEYLADMGDMMRDEMKDERIQQEKGLI